MGQQRHQPHQRHQPQKAHDPLLSARHSALLVLAALLCCAGCVTTTTSSNTLSEPPGGAEAPNRADASRINVQLGVNYLSQGQLEIAQQKLERALTEDPENPDAHAAMALLDERLDKSKDADREYRRALALSHRAPATLNSYGVYLCSHGRGDEGVRAIEEAAANPLYNTSWVAYTNAGVCLQSLHREADAMAQFERALQANPSFAEAALRAADLNFSQHQYAEGRLRIDLYLLSYRPTPDLLLLGWRIAGAQQDTSGQARYASRLTQEFPDSQQAHAVAMAAVSRN